MTRCPGLASLFALSLLAPACTRSPGAVTAPLGAPSPPAAARPVPAALVWTSDDSDARETWTLDATGNVLARTAGIRLTARGKLWQWKQAQQTIETQACPLYDEHGGELPPGEPATPGTGVRATLERVDGGEIREIVAAEACEGAADVEQTVDLLATVGPYLFVRDATYVYSCGAHGGVGVSFSVWDAERGAAVWSSGDTEPRTFVEPDVSEQAHRRALADLGEDEDVTSFGDDGEIDVAPTELLPAFDGPRATLRVAMQFTAPSCYACSDGAWSSYSKSTAEPLSALPAALRPWTVAPAAVRAFLAAHPEVTLGGWSAATAS